MLYSWYRKIPLFLGNENKTVYLFRTADLRIPGFGLWRPFHGKGSIAEYWICATYVRHLQDFDKLAT